MIKVNTLKVLRAKKDVSQQELGEKLGVSQNIVSSWEKGYTKPSTKNMLKMADFFEISLSEVYDIFLQLNTIKLYKNNLKIKILTSFIVKERTEHNE